ncbi:hypothetical protein AAE478_000973 [Parahypoxylon ruwenzoriense]
MKALFFLADSVTTQQVANKSEAALVGNAMLNTRLRFQQYRRLESAPRSSYWTFLQARDK